MFECVGESGRYKGSEREERESGRKREEEREGVGVACARGESRSHVAKLDLRSLSKGLHARIGYELILDCCVLFARVLGCGSYVPFYVSSLPTINLTATQDKFHTSCLPAVMALQAACSKI